jgi:uncharacterized OB-fold protein
VNYLDLTPEPHLWAYSCTECGALFFDRRNACARCSAQTFAKQVLQNTGVVRSFTIVHRAPSSVPTPYTSCVVELDGGGFVKANLVGVDGPATIQPGMRVELTTSVIGIDDDGNEAIAFAYQRKAAS